MQTDSEIKTDNLTADEVSGLLTGYVPYNIWITKHYPDSVSAYMNCHEAVLRMVARFPELVAVRGHVYVGINYRTHWWCVAPDGEIVDPTAHQWANKVLKYDPWEGEEPLGKCLECGEYTYGSNGGQLYLCARCLGT